MYIQLSSILRMLYIYIKTFQIQNNYFSPSNPTQKYTSLKYRYTDDSFIYL